MFTLYHVYNISRQRGGGCEEIIRNHSIISTEMAFVIPVVAPASQGPVGEIYNLTKLRALASHEPPPNKYAIFSGASPFSSDHSCMQLAPIGQSLMKEL